MEQLHAFTADLDARVDQFSAAAAQQANNATQSITESINGLKTSADLAYLFSLVGVGAGTAGIAIGVVPRFLSFHKR